MSQVQNCPCVCFFRFCCHLTAPRKIQISCSFFSQFQLWFGNRAKQLKWRPQAEKSRKKLKWRPQAEKCREKLNPEKSRIRVLRMANPEKSRKELICHSWHACAHLQEPALSECTNKHPIKRLAQKSRRKSKRCARNNTRRLHDLLAIGGMWA